MPMISMQIQRSARAFDRGVKIAKRKIEKRAEYKR
jgi:hypothetical protein